MARPRKNNADWFSHDTSMRDSLKVKTIRTKFGLEWYAVFVMTLEVLADAENFQLEDNDFQVEMLAGDFRLDPEKLKEFLTYFKSIWILQSKNWKIFSEHLIERMTPLLSKRENMRQKHQDKTTAWSDEASPPEPPKEASKPPKKELMTDEDFESFWKIYPKKLERAKSIEKFKKIERSMLDTILEAVKLQKNTASWKKQDGQFVPYPTTWLNWQRWNDDPASLDLNTTTNGKVFWHTGKAPSNQGRVSKTWHADLVV